MAAGTYTNSLQALNGIYGALDTIIKGMNIDSNKPKNEADRIKNENDIKKLNRGSLDGIENVNKKTTTTDDIKIPSANYKEIASMLSSLPIAIKMIAGLNGKTIRSFEHVMNTISSVMLSFANSERELKGAKNVLSLAEALNKLQDVKFFSLLMSFSVADRLKVADKMQKVLIDISKSVNSVKDLDEKNVKKLAQVNTALASLSDAVKRFALLAPVMPLFDVSVALMYPGLLIIAAATKKFSNNSSVSAAAKSTEIMNAFVKGMLSVVASTIILGTAIKVAEPSTILAGLAVSLAIMAALTGLSIVITLAVPAVIPAMAELFVVSKFIKTLASTTAIIMGLAVIATFASGFIIPGLGIVAGIMLSLSALAMLIGFTGSLLLGEFKAVRAITRFISTMVLVTGITILLGTLAGAAAPLITKGIGIVTGIILGYTALAMVVGALGALVKLEEDAGLINSVLKLAGIGLALTMGTILLGALAAQGWEYAAIGLLAVSVILTSFTGIATLMQLVGKKTFKLEADGSIKNILLFAGSCILITLGVVAIGAAISDVGIGWTLAGLVAFNLIMTSVLGTAELASIIGKNKSLKTGAAGLKEIGIFAAECMGLALGVILIAKTMESMDQKWMIAASFGLVSAIMFAGLGLAVLATRTKRQFRQGAKDIKDALLLIGAAELVSFGVLGLAKAIESANPTYVAATFVMMTGIILGAYGIAKLASRFSKDFKKGAIDILLAEGIALGSVIVLAGIVKVAEEAKGNWGNIFATIGAMTTVIGLVAGLAVVAGMLTTGPQAAVIFAGIGALALCEVLALGALAVLKKTLILAKEYNRAEDWPKISNVLGDVAKLIGLNAALAIASTLTLSAVIVGNISMRKIAKTSDSILKLMTNFKNVSKLEFNSVEIAKTFDTVSNLISSYAELSKDAVKWIIPIELGSIALRKAARNLNVITSVVEKYINVVSTLEKRGLSAEAVTSSMEELLKIISPEILVKGMEAAGGNYNKINKSYRSYKKVLDIVKGSFDMFGDFIKKTRNTKIDPTVLTAVADQMGGAMIEFMNHFDNVDFSRRSKKSAERMGEALATMIEPLSRFAELLSKYTDTGDGTLAIIMYDDKGIAHIGKSVNTTKVANILSTAVMNFCSVLFSEENKKKWESLASGSEKEQDKLSKGIGIFATIIEPISKFAEILTQFESQGNDTLIIPEYDDKGNLKPTSRRVNVIAVANVLAGAVSTFIKALYVDHKSDWMNIISSLNEIDPSSENENEKAGNTSGLSSAIGVFGDILNPIMNFASVLLKFSSDGKTLTVIDENGKPHPVDIIPIASGIATTVTEFVTRISNTFAENAAAIENLKANAGNIVEIISSIGTNISSLAELDTKKLEESSKILPVAVSTISDSILDLIGKISVSELNRFNDIFGSMNTSISEFLQTGIKADDLIKFETNVNKIGLLLDSVLVTSVSEDRINNFRRMTTYMSSALSTLISDEFITNTEEFNDKYDTLIKNINSSAEIGKVKKIKGLGDAVKKTSDELKKFDRTLSTGNKNRIKDLKEFGNALKPISDSLANVRSDLATLTTLLNAFRTADVTKVRDVIEQLGDIRIGGGGSGSGGGTRVETIRAGVEQAMSAILDGAHMHANSIGIKKNPNPSNGGYNIDELDLILDVNSYTYASSQGANVTNYVYGKSDDSSSRNR